MFGLSSHGISAASGHLVQLGVVYNVSNELTSWDIGDNFNTDNAVTKPHPQQAQISHSRKGKIMKKVTQFYDKQLRRLLEMDEEFKQTQMIHFAHSLVNYVVEISILRTPVLTSFNVVSPSTLTTPSEEILAVLKEAYEKTSRIEAHLFVGVADACIGINIDFISKNGAPILSFLGGVDSMGVRKLDLTIFDELRSAEHFSATQRRFSFLRRDT